MKRVGRQTCPTRRRRTTRLAALLLVVSAFAPGLASSQVSRVDGVAALVGGTTPGPAVTVLLRSDVDLRARMRLAGRRPDAPLPLGPLPPALLEATLDELIGEALIEREALRVQIARPSARDLARERARLATLAGGPARLAALLDALGADRSEVDAMAERRASVAVFLAANLEGIAPTDAELERAYVDGGHPFVDRPLEDVREPLRAYLTQRNVQRAVQRWVTSLRARTPMRVVARYRIGG